MSKRVAQNGPRGGWSPNLNAELRPKKITRLTELEDVNPETFTPYSLLSWDGEKVLGMERGNVAGYTVRVFRPEEYEVQSPSPTLTYRSGFRVLSFAPSSSQWTAFTDILPRLAYPYGFIVNLIGMCTSTSGVFQMGVGLQGVADGQNIDTFSFNQIVYHNPATPPSTVGKLFSIPIDFSLVQILPGQLYRLRLERNSQVSNNTTGDVLILGVELIDRSGYVIS